MAKPKQTREAKLETALKDLVAACGCVPISALKGETVKDFRMVLAFMAACDAAKELVGED
jgi:hypothetical protein